jgi:Ricin-type beta-trefoil lectin domain
MITSNIVRGFSGVVASLFRTITGRGDRRPGRVTTIALCGLVAASVGATTLVGVDIILADNAVAGRPVDARTAQTITLAALSCPSLNGPRLAGQLMANSGLDPTATTADGGSGIAGLSPAVFNKWAPWPNATPTDPVADVYALAHYMCDLIGQARAAGIPGDQWENALASHRQGIADVRKAGGVPSAAREYVDNVSGYAAWYAEQPVFSGMDPAGGPSASASAALGSTADAAATTAPKQLTDADLRPVLAAGRLCKEVTPARIAAQLMASSGFDPNLRSDNGAMGIAQFLPDLWSQHAGASDSPWDPSTAVPVLERAMCDLTKQLASLGGDPYQLALAAFRVGPTAVRQSAGLPKVADVHAFVAQVLAYADAYAKDPRISPGAPSPSRPGSPSAAPSSHPSPTPGSARQPAAPASPAPTQTFTKPADRSGQITQLPGMCLDVTSSVTDDGTQIQLWGCDNTAAQQWTIGTDGTIRALGKCLDVAFGGTANGTKVQLWGCDNTGSQQWVYTSHELVNPQSNKCLSGRGGGTSWGTPMEISDCQSRQDQLWNPP